MTILNVTGNITSGNVIGGNLVSATYISGNGTLITSLTGANVTGTVANANYSTYSGIASSANTVTWSNISSKPTTVTGFGITDAYSNTNLNSYLTAFPPAGTYSNSNVASYLPTFTGNITAANITTTGNITVGSGNYFVGNGFYITRMNGANVTGTVANSNYSAYSGIASSANTVTWSNVTGTPTSIGGYGITDAYGNSNVISFLAANPPPGSYSNTNVQNYIPTYTGNISPSNVWANSGTVKATTLIGTLDATASSQPNITTIGTLSSLTVHTTGLIGNITSDNANLGNLTKSNYFSGNASLLFSITGANVSGKVASATIADSANSVTLANVTGAGNIAGINRDGTTSNVLYGNGVFAPSYSNTNVQNYLPTYTGNITSGNANLGNLTSSNYFSGNASLLVSMNGANVTGTVANSVTAGTVIASAQPNITSVGTLSSVSVTANANVGNLNSTGNVNVNNTLQSTGIGTGALIVQGGASITKDLYVGGNIYVPNLIATNSTTLNVTTPLLYLGSSADYPYSYEIGFYSNFALTGGASAPANGYQHTGLVRNHTDNAWYLFSNAAEPAGTTVDLANANLIFDTLKLGNITLTNTGNANLGNLARSNYFSGNGSLLTSITGANISGQVSNALVTGTVYTNAQPNITSVGTLTSLKVGNATANIAFGNATIDLSGVGSANLGNSVTANFIIGDGYKLANITAANVLGFVPNANIANTAYSIAGANVSGAVSSATTASTVTTAAQPNITSVGTMSNITMAAQGNISGGNVISAVYLSGTLLTAAQTNITSVGTLGSLTVTANATVGNLNTAGNVWANTGTVKAANFVGDGSLLSGITATTALTVTQAAQTSITSLGTLTDLTISGNLTMSGTNPQGRILGVTSLTAGNITGTITTNSNAQPNITSVGTLVSLKVGNTTANTTFGNATITLTSNGNVTLSGSLSQISGANLVSATNLSGNIVAAASSQPNITSVGTLLDTTLGSTNSFTGGNLVSATYLGGKLIATSNAQPNITSVGTLLDTTLGSTNSFTGGNLVSATYLGGTLVAVSSSQPNITSVGTLLDTTLGSTNSFTGGNLVSAKNLGGNLTVPANGNIVMSGVSSQLSGANLLSANNVTITANGNIAMSGSASKISGANLINGTYLQGTLIAASSSQPNITSLGTMNDITMGTQNNISGGNSLSATYLVGTVYNATQTNITKLGTLLDTTMGSTNSFTGGNLISASFMSIGTNGNLSIGANGNIAMSGASSQIAGANLVSANNITVVTNGIVTIGANGNIAMSGASSQIAGANLVSSNNITLTANGNIAMSGSVSQIAGANLVSANNITVATNGVVTIGANGNIAMSGSVSQLAGANLVSASYLAGTLTTAAQPNITSVGTLTSVAVTNFANVGNIRTNAVSDTQVVYGNSNTLVSSSGFTFDSVGAVLTVPGLTITGNLVCQQSQEVFQAKTGATGVVAHNFSLGSTFYHTNMSSNFTVNVTNLPTTTLRVTVIVLMLVQGATPYYASAFQIGGAAQTIKWLNALTPVVYPNRTEMQIFTIFNNGGTYTVTSSIVSYG